MRVAARLTDSARFFGSVSVGLCTRERQSTVTRPFRDTAREGVCRLAAMMNLYYRDRCSIRIGLGLGLSLSPPCSVEDTDEPGAGAAAALFAHDLGVDA
jgi:hypothetical protein